MAETLTTSHDTASSSQWLGLKSRIKDHYDRCSTYYYSLWGEHIHHGYWTSPELSKEQAQMELIKLLVKRAGGLERSGIRVLDVGCGIGGTSRYLAQEHGCQVTGITISDEQVRMAKKLSGGDEHGSSEAFIPVPRSSSTDPQSGDAGSVRFIELDAEKMGEYFEGDCFDIVWISEALSHFPNKALFFQAATKLLQGGREKCLIIADWFKAPNLTPEKHQSDIVPIEAGMLLPPLCTRSDYVQFASDAGLATLDEALEIGERVSATWDISIGLVADPKLWALAITQGRDFVAFLRAFQAMRAGFRNKTFEYAVLAFQAQLPN